MSVINRITTWASQILTSASLNGEFNNVVNVLNNLDSATSSWTNVKVATLTTTTATTLKGTATNDSAAAGNIGEYMVSTASFGNMGATGAYSDIATLSLTAGDWDVRGSVSYKPNGSSFSTFGCEAGISTTSGNSSTGLVDCLNWVYCYPASQAAFLDWSLVVTPYRISLATPTTVYLKGLLTAFSGATPQVAGSISARRVR